jgi:hypothetical protein
MLRKGANKALVDSFELDEKQQQEAPFVNMEKPTLRLDSNRSALMPFAQECKRGYEHVGGKCSFVKARCLALCQE